MPKKQEPKINLEEIVIQKAKEKRPTTIEGYIVDRIEKLERTIAQQSAIIGMLAKENEQYEDMVEVLRKNGDLGKSGYLVIRIYNDEQVERVNKILKLKAEGEEHE